VKSSAYLSLLDDYELLGAAMASIAPRVDEIVVVDGAYRWMAPFFAAVGRDPERSVDRVRDVMAPYAHKTRWITGLWESELDKRAAGYAGCRYRWIWRVDADELHFIRDGAVERFISSGRAVGEMEIPVYVAPGLVRGQAGAPIERTSLLFDSSQIDPRSHLSYLWLVIPEAERAKITPWRHEAIQPEAIAFTAHLTGWRPPLSAAARARFYVLNYLRTQGGAQPGALLRWDQQAGFAPMLQDVPPAALMGILQGHAIVAGLPDLGERGLIPTPLSPAEEAGFAPLYTAYLDSLAALNAALGQQARAVAAGMEMHIDLSTPAAAAPFLVDGAFRVSFTEPVAAGRAILGWLHGDAPFLTEAALQVTIDGGTVRIALPAEPRPALRRVLRLAVWAASGAKLLWMRAGP
jgi:hypothetical protein